MHLGRLHFCSRTGVAHGWVISLVWVIILVALLSPTASGKILTTIFEEKIA